MFAHEKLIAYQVAREWCVLAAAIVRRMPRCERRDQLSNASDSILQNAAEGAGRRSGRDKAKFFDYARASAEECAAILDLLNIHGVASNSEVAQGRALLLRAVRLLSGLARSALRRSA